MNPYEKLHEMLKEVREEKRKDLIRMGFKRAYPNLKNEGPIDGPRTPKGYPIRFFELHKLKFGKRWSCYNERLDKPQPVKVIL